MAYKALYRTYRPTSFDEVAGQQHIVKTLKNALLSNKIAHAYLFAGPRGTGKTSIAKIFAKSLNCDEGIGHECNHCKNCLAVNEGSHPDVIEIDAASNNGVEEVRDLIDKVKYSPILGRYKVYIIDEVHMMSSGAFNALLKTLEEPPEHVIFILATTEPHKILPTILSRCQRYDFSKLSDVEIKDRLKYVLEKEDVAFDDRAVDLIISLCDGGMRDALSILDQVLAYSQNRLNYNDILDIFSLESTDEKVALLKDAGKSNTAKVLERIDRYITKGSDIKRLTSDLLDILKEVLIYKRTRSEQYLRIINLGQANDLSAVYSDKLLQEAMDYMLNAVKDFKSVNNINPIFEIALLKLCSNRKQEPTTLVDTLPEVPPETQPHIPVSITPARFEPKVEEKKQDDVVEIIPKEATKEPAKEEVKPEIKEEKKEQPSILDTTNFSNVKIDTRVIYPKKALLEEGGYRLEESLIIDIMTVSKKEIKASLLANWDKLASLAADPKYSAKATLLHDAHLLVATKDIALLEYDLTNKVNKVNIINNQADFQAIFQLVFKKKMFVYALDRSESVDYQQKFRNLKQVSKLSKPETIQIDMLGE